MLQNRIYRGEIVHKDQHYPGEHAPIIERVLWDEVQRRLAANAVARGTSERVKTASLLAGLLFDGDGHRMTPTHAVKKGTRYRYYVSRPLITESRADAPDGLRIPAGDIEQVVTAQIGQLLCDPARLFEVLAPCLGNAVEQQHIVQRAGDLAATWSALPAGQLRGRLATLIRRIEVRVDRVVIELLPSRLGAVLRDAPQGTTSTIPPGEEQPIILSVAAELRRAGLGMVMVVDGAAAPGRAARPDAKLIKLIARAHLFKEKLVQTQEERLLDVARRENLCGSYFTRVVRLTYLAPDITRAILEGRHPRDLTAEKLLEHSRLPLAWPEQRRLLGFA